MQVSIDCDFPGLYLGACGLKPPACALVFSVLAGESSSTFLAIRRARASDAVTFNSGDRGSDVSKQKPVGNDLTHRRSFVRVHPARVETVIDKCGQAIKGAGWMSWHREATKDVVACDKPREAGKQALIRGCLNEETRPGNPRSSPAEFIGRRSEPRELKHLSTWRNRKRHRFRQ